MLDLHVKPGTLFSLRDKRLFEISEVEMNSPNYILEDSNFDFRYVRLCMWFKYSSRKKWFNYLQIVETLIRRSALWRLIWVCTVCQLPFWGSPNYNSLSKLDLISRHSDHMPRSAASDLVYIICPGTLGINGSRCDWNVYNCSWSIGRVINKAMRTLHVIMNAVFNVKGRKRCNYKNTQSTYNLATF